jgi:RecA-family ATPase
MLPEGLNLLVGKPKIGKGWLVLATGIAIAAGGYALGKVRVQQGDCLYLA